MQENHYGTVIFFDGRKGFGFLSWEINGAPQTDIFVHFSDIDMQGYRTLFRDQKVSFEIGICSNGKPKAINVVILRH